MTVAASVLALAGGGLGVALADTGTTAAGTISCPDVASRLPAVPARAQAEVARNLALLQTQISEANRRLATSAGQGGPNFVRNAILGPLADKRRSTIDRIVLSIGRAGTPLTGLDSLATCSMSTAGADSATNGGGRGGGANNDNSSGGGDAHNGGDVGSGNDAGGNGGTNDGGGREDTGVQEQPAAPPPAAPAPPAPPARADDPGAGGRRIDCPAVANRLSAVPAQARAEVEENLALLNTQIAEANRRLATSAGQGGPNFVQNAIVGPLEDKRVATLNRIATAIGRSAARPAGLDALAGCTVRG